MITISVFDTLGRRIAKNINITERTLVICEFSKFFIIFIYTALVILSNTFNFLIFSFLLILNIIIFSLSSGFLTSQIFILGTNRVDNDNRGKISCLLNVTCNIGILLGTINSTLVMKNFIKV